jgi:hypothetical protein
MLFAMQYGSDEQQPGKSNPEVMTDKPDAVTPGLTGFQPVTSDERSHDPGKSSSAPLRASAGSARPRLTRVDPSPREDSGQALPPLRCGSLGMTNKDRK